MVIHLPRFEHQSRYFCQVQTTIVPVVLMFQTEDVTNISPSERDELIELFSELKLPNVTTEIHYLISSEMPHDNLFVQKGLDVHILSYIKELAPHTTTLHIRSDGCKVLTN